MEVWYHTILERQRSGPNDWNCEAQACKLTLLLVYADGNTPRGATAPQRPITYRELKFKSWRQLATDSFVP